MPDIPIDLIKGDSVGSETDYRDALPVNMYGVIKPLFGAAGYMIQFSGLQEYAQGSAKCRGGVWNERFNTHFRVLGNDFVEIGTDGTVTVLGSVSGSDTVSLPYSFNTQAIIADGKYYLYDPTNGFRQVTDSDLGNPLDAVWVDGYYFFTDGEFLFHTEISDESEIDPLSFATSEYSPDPTLGVALTQDNKVAAFNRYTTEFFQNVANDNFAFQRLVQRTIKVGIVGTHCKTVFGEQFFVLGGHKQESVSCYMMSVGGARKIATREVEKVIGKYSENQLSTSVVESLSEDGYTFIIYHLPNDTLIYNYTLAMTTGNNSQAWSILVSERERNYRGIHCVNIPPLNKWTFGDKRNGNVGIYEETIATQYGDLAQWLLYTPFYYIEQASIDKLEIETIAGFTGSEDATVFISTSYNGFVYSREWTEIYGLPYNYDKRFIIRRLGYVRDWVSFRMRGLSSSRMAFARGFMSVG